MDKIKRTGLAALLTLSLSTANAGLLEILRDNGSITAEQYAELKQEQTEEIKTVGGSKLQFKGADYKYTIAGRFYQDFVHYNEDKTTLNSGSELRTSRIELKGSFYDNWKFRSQYGFDKDRTQTRFVWLGYQFENSILKVGRLAESNGLESNTSSRYTTFLERGLPVIAFAVSDFAEGVEYRWWNDNSHITTSVVLEPDATGDDEFRWHGRYSIALLNEPGKVLHLGGWANVLNPPSNTTTTSARFETHLDGRLLNTSVGNADQQLSTGLEFAWVRGPLSIQGEYMRQDISVKTGNKIGLTGYYAHASYFLTGESRSYYHDYGSFDRITPKGDKGALQLAIRYSELDFTENNNGKLQDVTLGVNWWPKKNIKFALNQVFADVTSGVGGDESPSATIIRAQIDF